MNAPLPCLTNCAFVQKSVSIQPIRLVDVRSNVRLCLILPRDGAVDVLDLIVFISMCVLFQDSFHLENISWYHLFIFGIIFIEIFIFFDGTRIKKCIFTQLHFSSEGK